MKYYTFLLTLVLATILNKQRVFSRQVEGASVDHLGRSYDGRNPGNHESHNEHHSEGPNGSKTSTASQKESTAQKAARELGDLSTGIGLMIERNEKVIHDLKAKGTVSDAGKKMIETQERESAKLVELAGKTAAQN